MTGGPPPNLFERRLSRFSRKPASVRNAARVIVTTTLAIVVLGGVAIRLLDSKECSTIWEGMWWSLQTVTTVGYGDVTPTGVAGRLVGAALMLEGVALLTIVTAVITTTFVTREQSERGIEGAADEALATQRLDSPTPGHHRTPGSGRADAQRAIRQCRSPLTSRRMTARSTTATKRPASDRDVQDRQLTAPYPAAWSGTHPRGYTGTHHWYRVRPLRR